MPICREKRNTLGETATAPVREQNAIARMRIKSIVFPNITFLYARIKTVLFCFYLYIDSRNTFESNSK